MTRQLPNDEYARSLQVRLEHHFQSGAHEGHTEVLYLHNTEARKQLNLTNATTDDVALNREGGVIARSFRIVFSTVRKPQHLCISTNLHVSHSCARLFDFVFLSLHPPSPPIPFKIFPVIPRSPQRRTPSSSCPRWTTRRKWSPRLPP